MIEIEGKITELVNPKVVRRSGTTVDWEGCLSIPGFVAEIERWRRSRSRPATGTAGVPGQG